MLSDWQGYNHQSVPVVQRAGSAPPLVSQDEGLTENRCFLGFTSHASIMTEDLMQIGLSSTGLKQTPTVYNKRTINDRLASGCRVLSFLQNRAMIDRGIDLFFESIECIHIHCGEIIVRQWLSELWSFHTVTLSSQNIEQIQRLYELLCQNTATPLVFDGSTTARQWIQSATGRNIRWATIAVIASYVGTYAMLTKSSDPFFKEFNIDRETLICQMLEVAEVSTSLCRECDALDDAFLCAQFEIYGITAYTKGQACYATYRIGAELNSALIAMGFHQEIRANNRVPFFLAELRKRLRAMVYGTEINIATFLGRPPRLSHRYVNLDPPLDLTDLQLFSEDPQELAIAIARLDEQGYNRDGEIRHVSWVRSHIKFLKRREEILELSLGDYSPDEVLQKAVIIRRETEEHWTSLPHYMQSLKESLSGLDTHEILDLHLQNVFRQGPQANSLLLNRVLVHKAGVGPAELIHTAQGILSDVMRSYKRIEMSATTSFIYFLAVHGIRSAVILATELLKQEQLTDYPDDPILPRSRTIQDLCIFANKIIDLDPVFGSKSLFEKGKEVILLILDKILSPPKISGGHRGSLPVQARRLDETASINDMFQTTQTMFGSESCVFMDNNFSHDDRGAAIFGPDYDFGLWLENNQNWNM